MITHIAVTVAITTITVPLTLPLALASAGRALTTAPMRRPQILPHGGGDLLQ